MQFLAMDPTSVVAWILWGLVLVALAGVVYALVTDDREPTIVLAWLFVILLLPVIGIVAYFFVGRDFRRQTTKRDAARAAEAELTTQRLAPVLVANHTFSEDVTSSLDGTPGQRIERAGHHEGGMVPLPADSVRLYFAGADKFADLLTDMRAARRYIHLMYLIWEMDRLTAEVTDILLERLSAGVEVHILYAVSYTHLTLPTN